MAHDVAQRKGRQRNPAMYVSRILAGAVVASAVGCAGVPPPREELAQAERAVDQAMAENAVEFAALEVEKARDKLAQARAEMSTERYADARRLAEEALVDAELALAKADAAKTTRNADELAQTVQRLREEAQLRSRAPAMQ